MLRWNYFERNPIQCLEELKTKAFIDKLKDETGYKSKHEFPGLVNQMKLTKYFPGKLTLEEALTINTKVQQQSVFVEELPWLMLKTIITGNFKFRESILEDYDKKLSETRSREDGKQTSSNLIDMSSDSESDSESTDEKRSLDLHPVDVLLVLFVCCDASLKALVAQKLFACQLAIPFIYNDMLNKGNIIMSLWPIRGVFTITENHAEESVVTQKTSIISFIRVGKPGKLSKSKFVNEIIRHESEMHNTFFHRDCKFGTCRRTISDGTVEISWYLPLSQNSYKQAKMSADSQLQKPFTILNLRGNAEHYRKQTTAILGMSRIVIVFIELADIKEEKYTELLTKIYASGAYIILFTRVDTDKKNTKKIIQRHLELTGGDKSKICLFSTFDRGLKREYNACEMKEELIKIISTELVNRATNESLENASEKLSDVHVDERDKRCSLAKQLAISLFSQITEIKEYSKRKDTILPLQGENLWRKWAKLQKDDMKSSKNVTDERRNAIWTEMNEIRKSQVTALNNSPNVMARFVEILIWNIDNSDMIRYFLAWLKRFIDDESRRILPELRKRLHSAFHEYEAAKSNKGTAGNAASKEQTEHVEGAKVNLENASLGLEHFYRELGQVYEAFMESKHIEKESEYAGRNHISNNTLRLLEILPFLAVKLLQLGQPLELMDGDASNVPQRWTQDVFKALQEIFKNKSVVSISVLGIQSSGKSTLLNTMFGLQFSVSAGRCTRGVFLQLLPIRSDKEPSYALIIDTEGLRAPELSGMAVSCDNELATLVIGLADVIIINIKGETMGEMENVLQIVVHELLRLKQAHANLELCQSVILVHQNISAQDAASHLAQGNLSIVTNLNKVTKEAALQAGMSGIECFKDVIQFSAKDHVKYVSDLWLGNPPMAPVNPKYCAQAEEVTDAIFKDLVGNQEQFLSVENFSQHLSDLWKAILAEDFVFSFTNGLQIKAYNLLENEFLNRKWQLESLKMKWEEENIKPKLKACSNDTEIRACEQTLITTFTTTITEQKITVIKSLEEYLMSSELSQHMADSQDRKKQRLEDITDELNSSVKKKIQTETEQCKYALKQAGVLEKRKQTIHIMATTIATSMQGQKPTENEKIYRFNDFWQKEVEDAQVEEAEESNQNRMERIKYEIKSLLVDHYRKDSHLLQLILGKSSLSAPLEGLEDTLNNVVKDEHISVEGQTSFSFFRKIPEKVRGVSKKHKDIALSAVNSLLRRIEYHFGKLLKTDIDYDKTLFSIVLQMVREAFISHNKSEANVVKLSPALEVMVSVQVARYACTQFYHLSINYQTKHSIKAQLEEYKPSAWQLFEDILSKKTEEIIAANGLVIEIKGMLRERVQRHLPYEIRTKIQRKFGNSKHELIRAVLEDLIDKNFQCMFQYIRHPAQYVTVWLEKLINETFFKRDGNPTLYSTEANGYLSEKVNNVRSFVDILAKQHKEKPTMCDWIDQFKEMMTKEELIVKPDSFRNVTTYNINNFEEFSNYIKERLSYVENELSEAFGKCTPQNIVWPEASPYQVIFKSLWGCTETCPFCSEPCLQSDPPHTGKPHKCIQHRPSGIDGVHDERTKVLVLDSCSFLLHKDTNFLCGTWCNCSVIKEGKKCTRIHKFREYKTYQKDWDILPKSDHPSSEYWAWCMVHFSEQLAEAHGLQLPNFPTSWKCVTKEEALKSLDKYQ